jgi:aspartate/methionine/tyrosine aminotransferase
LPVRIPSRVADITLAQFDALNARAAELRAQGHRVISLGQALPGFGPPPQAIAAARRALETGEAHVYSADAGLPALRRSLAGTLGFVTPGEIIITAGGNQAFMLALMTLVDPGDEVLLPSPYFVNHEMAAAAIGAVPREVALDEANGFALRWRDLEPHITSRTRAVVVCSPGNPTGAVVERDELTRVVRELAARGIVLFSDETYARFVYEGEHASAADEPAWRENVVIVGTFSKAFGMTGWRVGYLLADARVCAEAVKIQDAMIICAPVVSQVGAEAAVRECWDYALGFTGDLMGRRRILADRLARIPGLGWTPGRGGFFAFVRVDGCSDSAALSRRLLEEAHVVTIPGSTFGRRGEGFIRLSYSAVSREDLVEASERIAGFFA